MTQTETLSRGAELMLKGPFYAYADHITTRVMEVNPSFTREYVDKLVKAWADVATLTVEDGESEDPKYVVTPHMVEVTAAALSLARMFVSFMSAIGGGRFVQWEAPREYASIEDLVRTRIALVTSGFGADIDVWGVA
ncbi:hypothetical protein [Kitasatospora sp. NPDC088351]|uniref:hypothetical protein n=1 Tax=Kitasatospora sp. NPDC088351 TaxID=3155180 RepID=UPI00344AF27B